MRIEYTLEKCVTCHKDTEGDFIKIVITPYAEAEKVYTEQTFSCYCHAPLFCFKKELI